MNISTCLPKPCKNEGICINATQSSPSQSACVCKPGFTGSICDKVEEQLPVPPIVGIPPGASNTYTGASQHNTGLGPSNNTSATSDPHHVLQTFFNNTALPKHMECDPSRPCCLQVPYHGEKGLPPVLGFYDKDLKIVSGPEVITSDDKTDLHVAEVCMKGVPGKIHRLCLQTTTNGTKKGVNLDELCVEVEEKTPALTVQPEAGPQFINNLPDGTEILCKPNTICHVHVRSETTDGFCEQVATCLPGQSDVHTFPTEKTADDTCITDVAVQAANYQGMKTSVCLTAGSGGQHLSLVVKASHEDAFGHCRELHCLNGGKCLSMEENRPAVCKCPDEFTGPECEAGPQCTKEDIEHAREMVLSGLASCTCVVNGKNVNIINKRPVVKKQKLYSAAGFGAGGMIGAMVVGVVVYFTISKLKQTSKSFRPRSPKQKVHPKILAYRRNMDF